MLYSFVGWLIEVTKELLENKKFVNRGFLIGPYCPIYGVGIVMLTICLQKTVNDMPSLFLKSFLICSVLEYFTSYLLEKIYKYRWWDYTYRKFNINGRICLENMVPFSLGACIIIKIINPLLFKIISYFSENFITVIFIILLIIFLTDFILSLILMGKIKGIEKNIKTDSTEDIRSQINSELKGYIFYRRVFDSFPSLKITKKEK